MRRPLPLAFLMVAACGDTTAPNSTTGVLTPDTQTVAGVLEMRHPADAFERAPQWRLDTVPLVMFDGGEEVDLSAGQAPQLLSDGRAVFAQGYRQEQQLRLFERDGTPGRVLAREGSGPGEIAGPDFVLILPGDTILISDGSNASINRYTADSGFVRAERASNTEFGCYAPTGRLANGRHVGIARCSSNRRNPDGSLNPTMTLVTYPPDFSRYDTIGTVPGSRMKQVDITQGTRTFPVLMWLQLGQHTSVAAVDSTIVVGSGDGGYVLDLRDVGGMPMGRIVVDRPAVMVNEEMRRAVIAQQIERAMTSSESGITRERAEELVNQEPFADTLASYQLVTATLDGTIWVRDTQLPGDSTWSATAFRRDGAILGRLSGLQSKGYAAWLGDDRATVRHEDEDGVVRYGVYRIVRP
jgi:hypothetical protein